MMCRIYLYIVYTDPKQKHVLDHAADGTVALTQQHDEPDHTDQGYISALEDIGSSSTGNRRSVRHVL